MAIVEIGVMYDVTDPDNVIVKDGWHVDSIDPIAGADAYLIEPKNPQHAFMGVDVSYRYKFADREQALLYLQTDPIE